MIRKFTKYEVVVLWAALTLVLLVAPRPARAAYPWVIDTLDVRLVASDDNSYLITETYGVSFNEQRHGIQRNLPLSSYRGNPVEIRDIFAAGRPLSARKDGGELVVRVGDPDKWANSKERYTLSYVYDIGDDGLKDMDELYYNILPDYDTTIGKMTFTIEMPRAFDADRLNFTHGLKGSRDNTYVEWNVNGTVITGRLTRTNRPHEQLTVALPLPKGYFTSAAGRTHREEFSLLNLAIALAAAGASFLFWYFWGKERKIFPAVEFYPPPGLNPADAGYIMYGEVGGMDVISFIIYWADKGYLRISDIANGFSLRKLRDPDPDAKPYETKLFGAMFSRAKDDQVTTSDLAKKEFYSDLDSARKDVVRFHKDSPGTRIFKKGTFKLLIGAPSFIFLLITIFAELGNSMEIEIVLFTLVIAGFFWFVLAIMGLLLGMSIKYYIQRGKLGFFITMAVIYTGLLGAIAVYLDSLVAIETAALIVPGTLMAISHRRTDLGLKYLEHLTGFKTFIKTAERDRIDMLANKNPQYFYNVLPYALTLGVTDTWAKKFEHVGLRPPEWYESGDSKRSFSSSSFASGISSGLSGFAKAVDASRPSSSDGDSSDGGSSGGGSGGGSGSSW